MLPWQPEFLSDLNQKQHFWKIFGHTASEEMSFVIVDDDERRIPTYPISSPGELKIQAFSYIL